MDERNTAERVLSAVGGKSNVTSNAICLTRLRIQVHDPDLVDRKALMSIASVLGMTKRGTNGIEVVFGPNVIDRIYESFRGLCSDESDAPEDDAPQTALPPITAERRRSYNVQMKANRERSASGMSSEDLDLLRGMFPGSGRNTATSAVKGPKVAVARRSAGRASEDAGPAAAPGPAPRMRRLLVINGPNINMLGIREPETYGTQDFPALLALCRESAKEAGFGSCLCYQSNHEGDIVDEIQDAFQAFDGLVINPGAYTHTSIAILDAIKAVQIPTIEVHISDIAARESFRQVSYVSHAAIETIAGMGIEGYRKAIFDMWDYLERQDRAQDA